MVHTIYVEGHVYLVLSDAEWYDTASPWRYCAAKLSQLDALVATTPVQIESFGEIHLIDGPDALLLWVERVFERSYSQGFGRVLRGRPIKNSGE